MKFILKKLMILSCSFIAASTFAIGREVKEETKTAQERIIFEHGIGLSEMFYHRSQMLPMPAPTKEPFFRDQNLQDWVKAAQHIRVRTMKTSFDVNIKAFTTVLDIKRQLQEDQGIPVEQQAINPVWPLWWSLGLLEDRAAALDNTMQIKDAMNTYNTSLFELYLQLRNK